MQKIEQIFGILTFGCILIGAFYAYQHHAIFPLQVLRGVLFFGIVWMSLYLYNIVKWYWKGTLFFTKSFRWFTIILFLGLALFLFGRAMSDVSSSTLNLQLAISFSFLLMGVANLKNFINLENPELIQWTDENIRIKWDDVIHVDIQATAFEISTQQGRQYTLPIQTIVKRQQQRFKTTFTKLVEMHHTDFELRHLIDSSE